MLFAPLVLVVGGEALEQRRRGLPGVEGLRRLPHQPRVPALRLALGHVAQEQVLVILVEAHLAVAGLVGDERIRRLPLSRQHFRQLGICHTIKCCRVK